LTLVVVNVLISIELIVLATAGFFIFLGLVSYGASLEEKNRQLEKRCKNLEKEKEQGK
jgi:hypothetical protein